MPSSQSYSIIGLGCQSGASWLLTCIPASGNIAQEPTVATACAPARFHEGRCSNIHMPALNARSQQVNIDHRHASSYLSPQASKYCSFHEYPLSQSDDTITTEDPL